MINNFFKRYYLLSAFIFLFLGAACNKENAVEKKDLNDIRKERGNDV